MEQFEEDFPYRGSRLVARAWTDPAFRQRLLDDGKAACAEFGIDLEVDRLIAVENTPDVHNLIVCTLCSCYPRALLGMPPTWYKSRNYRSRVVFEPRAVLKEFGTELPDNVTVRVHDSNADMRYVVIPMRPGHRELERGAARRDPHARHAGRRDGSAGPELTWRRPGCVVTHRETNGRCVNSAPQTHRKT